MTATPSPAFGYGPGDDIDNDGVPNVLDGTTAFLTQGSMPWHRSIQSLCRLAPFDAMLASRHYCLALVEHPWATPLPSDDAQEVATVIRRIISGDTLAVDAMHLCLANLSRTYPNSLDPIGSFFRSAVRGIADFSSIGIYNSRPRSERRAAVLVMRGLLVDAIRAQQLAP